MRRALALVALLACGDAYGEEETLSPEAGSPRGAIKFPEVVALEPAPCGQPTTGVVALSNESDVEASYELRMPESDIFALRGAVDGLLSGRLGPKGGAFVYVDAKSAKPGTAAINIATKSGDAPGQVRATVEVKGALLTMTPALVDFGDVRGNTVSAPIPIALLNEGTEPVTIAGFGGLTKDFNVAPSTSIVIAAGGETKIDATLTAAPAADTVMTATISPQTSALCGDHPSIELRGKRVNQDVTINPLSADFGDNYCNTTPGGTASITVTNYSISAAATYSAKLISGSSRFRIASGANAVVPPATDAATPAKATIVIAAKSVALPLGEFDEDLEVKITDPVPAATTKIVKLHIGAYGAILDITPPSLAGFAPNETKYFSIKNVGNREACVKYSDTSGNGFYIEADDVLSPNAAATFWVQFAAPAPGTYNYAIDITPVPCTFVQTAAVFCTPPIKPTVSATR